MNMQDLLYFQVIADIILCGTIVFLLIRLGRRMDGSAKQGNGLPQLEEFNVLLQESRNDVARFSQSVEESCEKFRSLVLELEDSEARLTRLLKKSNSQCERLTKSYLSSDQAGESHHERYDHIIKAYHDGAKPEEIARLSGMTEGEVSLLIDLGRKRQETGPG